MISQQEQVWNIHNLPSWCAMLNQRLIVLMCSITCPHPFRCCLVCCRTCSDNIPTAWVSYPHLSCSVHSQRRHGLSIPSRRTDPVYPFATPSCSNVDVIERKISGLLIPILRAVDISRWYDSTWNMLVWMRSPSVDSKFSNAGDIDANSRVHSVVLSGFGNSAV